MKNNVEIPFELLNDLYQNATKGMKERIEVYVPEIITKFKNGDWIKSINGSIICITDINKGFGYGFDTTKEWCYDGSQVWTFRSLRDNWTLASMKEVKQALREEAKRRGFTYGVNFKALDDKLNGSIIGNEPEKAKVGSRKFPYEEGVLYCSGYGKWAMFKDGYWARPYKNHETLKRIEKLKKQLEELVSRLN